MVNKVTLQQLLKWLAVDYKDDSIVVADLKLDNRAVQAGDVFIALSGFNVHGMDYAYQAERAGAVAVIAEPVKVARAASVGRQKPLKIPVIEVANLSDQLGQLASCFYGKPSDHLKVTAVTGTNGKTSTAWLMMHALEQLGVKTGYIGTLGVGDVDSMRTLQNTTPSAIEIQKNLAQMLAQGFAHVCIEVSSHALDQNRFVGTKVENALYTNLSRDHLDYHKTMKSYAATKLKLFTEFSAKNMVLNLDDSYARDWAKGALCDQHVLTYGIHNKAADFLASQIKLLPEGIAFKLHHATQSLAFQTSLLGQFNVENTMAVLAALHAMGYSLEALQPVVQNLNPVPGRMNRIDINSNGSIVVVDYAHTPDALEQVLKALKAHVKNDLWCVFGCGGNRDKGKRPMMGAIAETYADHVILTDDNPRFESSGQILADIEFGMQTKPHVISDRKQAITYVIDKSQRGDIILLAGKGHESTQEVNGELLHFNDMAVIKDIMQVGL
ncbi:UDP-N-acetylmuramoyl-L-alanyl-D-glutamate--2,6-diaminopimelate ligase [Marinicella litoralis]|uniref:UDP-N-acetylmuramoyl-L-alanyl-D-glutamate--2,6-diaminopimelate ligase n=1 Tax=Marinicella litoralis TaxID=644220 RepID=A0A4R6XWB4_9GAMM|nr:UDP-N-acetylmuramoyl-L-alanyl-D-glutamate--2,6-diaminopimelate ligase [Marinicella litoralis]TDR22730.1 UDP-N-acetylmuramoylalanyl-D-glutamate--2,6-diaminopimelate ligase [Marinicella litoralis]